MSGPTDDEDVPAPAHDRGGNAIFEGAEAVPDAVEGLRRDLVRLAQDRVRTTDFDAPGPLREARDRIRELLAT
ncbi:hypothetical protein ACWGGS_36250 [Streptomyces decoyicus]|uniref:Uncharacterized protein n=1 Tax=Streptomyces decoyicus TaxID=249567 RepID=A0ABZ1FI10_9ACTN|nr:hypothetical protein [Streptomyces decoyicus]WSB69664.1 hypothetical protein OG863_17845 [Streptomyces decoyicus]